ncbi:MAG TPA: formylglycine-generating enzyme family protein, partial [Myxococcaceae bacterium]
MPWEGARGPAGGATGDARERVERLLRLLSPATFVQHGLLRAIRKLLPANEVDAGTEADAWNHAAVLAADATGMVLHPRVAERWREELARDAQVHPATRRAAIEAIRHWREGVPRELVMGERAIWHAVSPGSVTAEELGEARAFHARLVATLQGGAESELTMAVRHYGRMLLWAMPAAAYQACPELGRLFVTSFERTDGVPEPEGVDLRALRAELGPGEEPTWWAVRQVGRRLVFSPSPAGGAWPSHESGPGSPVACLWAGRREISVRFEGGPSMQFILKPGLAISLPEGEWASVAADLSELTVRRWLREPWAMAAGRDRWGLWAEAEWNGAVQRFRWIPPGRFWMGSPEAERGRWPDEGPRHEVTISKGHWLGDTPVTQALWKAVMGENPSRFRSPDRPVEGVNWEDCRRFLARLNRMVEGLEARLPTEAEWEHGCRAGTSGMTWLGDFEIQGENDAPGLDGIAWYGGNSGGGYELEEGYDSSDWKERQYPHKKAGTRPVAMKAANPNGLFDLLGNVCEWCSDWWGGYQTDGVMDPKGLE